MFQEGLNIPADKMQPVIFAGDQPGANNKVSWMRDHKRKFTTVMQMLISQQQMS